MCTLPGAAALMYVCVCNAVNEASQGSEQTGPVCCRLEN